MRFSVIIPCYNAAPYLRETLLSLNKQTFKEFEVIIVDDGSTDNSYELANNLFKEFLFKGCVIRKPQNSSRGVSSSRNYGIKLAKGKWICFLDSDDLYNFQKLQIAFDIINKYTDNNIVALHHAYSIINEKSELIGQKVLSESVTIQNITPDLLKENTVCTSTVVVKREALLREGGFNESLNGVEDYFMWLLLSKRGLWLYVPEQLSVYRIHNSSLMRHRSFTHYVDQFVKFFIVFDLLNQFDNDEKDEVSNYMQLNLLNFHLRKCLKLFGRIDVLKGCIMLLRNGYFSMSFIVIKRIFLSVRPISLTINL